MKKLLLLFLVLSLFVTFTAQASGVPIEEKQVMVFVSDVGLVTLPAVLDNHFYDTNKYLMDVESQLILNSTPKLEVLYTDESLYGKILYEATRVNEYSGNYNLMSVYYGSNRIRYDPIQITA